MTEVPSVKKNDNVLDLAEEAVKRLDMKAVSNEAKAHIITMLRNRSDQSLHSHEQEFVPREGVKDVPLKGMGEIIYYASLLQDGTPRWDGEGEAPQGMWVNVNHPKVKAAEDLLKAYPSLFGTEKQGLYLDSFHRLWSKASEDERKAMVEMYVRDPNVAKWISFTGEPEPTGAYVQLDEPDFFHYLPDDVKEYVQGLGWNPAAAVDNKGE